MVIKIKEARHDDSNPYWDIGCLKKLLSYQADAYIAQSPRSYGKSYSGMELCLQNAIDKGENVAWGRYNKPEAGQAYNTWLEHCPNLVPMKAPDSPFKWLIDECTGGKVCIFTWSISQNAKGIDTPFKYMICDEFIPERYTSMPRMDTEFNDWDSVRKSLVRNWGTKVIMFSNNIYWQNPFFIKWGIPPFGKGKYLQKTDTLKATLNGETIKETRTIVVENVAGTSAIIKRNIKEQMLSFNSSEDLQRYFDNETKQEYTTIAECPDLNIPLSKAQYMSDGYYFNCRVLDGMYYWVKVRPDPSRRTFVAEPTYIDINKGHFRDTQTALVLEQIFNAGRCAFDDVETLNAFYRYLRNCRSRIS